MNPETKKAFIQTSILLIGTVSGVALGFYFKNSLMAFLIILATFALGFVSYRRLEQISKFDVQEWIKEKEEFYEKQIKMLEQEKETSQKRAEHLEKLNEQLKELQELFYILVRHGKVSVSDITKKWEEKYGKGSAFIVYEKGKGFNLKRESKKRKYLLEKLPERHGIELSEERRNSLWRYLQEILIDKSPFSEFLNEEYGRFSAPLFESTPQEPFHLLVFPRELRISPKDLAKIFQEEYVRYAGQLKERLRVKLNCLILNLSDSLERKVIQLIMSDVEQWNPTEGILLIIPFSAAEIPFGKFNKDALKLLEKYHPQSLEVIKEGLTETILRNLTFSVFLEYAGLSYDKIQHLENHEEEIKSKLKIKKWGEIFNIDSNLIQEVFSQYQVSEEELKNILEAIKKITEIIERPDRILRRIR